MAIGTHAPTELSPPVIPAAAVKVIYKVLLVCQAPRQGCDKHYLISASQPDGKQILLSLTLLSEEVRNKAQRG